MKTGCMITCLQKSQEMENQTLPDHGLNGLQNIEKLDINITEQTDWIKHTEHGCTKKRR